MTIPGIQDEPFDVPREHTRAWDPSHSLYLEVSRSLLFSFHVCGIFSTMYEVAWLESG